MYIDIGFLKLSNLYNNVTVILQLNSLYNQPLILINLYKNLTGILFVGICLQVRSYGVHESFFRSDYSCFLKNTTTMLLYLLI